MSNTEASVKLAQLLSVVFELKQVIDAMTDAPAELVDRMARVNQAAKALSETLAKECDL